MGGEDRGWAKRSQNFKDGGKSLSLRRSRVLFPLTPPLSPSAGQRVPVRAGKTYGDDAATESREAFGVRPACWRCRMAWGAWRAGASSAQSKRFARQVTHKNLRGLRAYGSIAVRLRRSCRGAGLLAIACLMAEASSGGVPPSPLHYSDTIRTEFLPPNGFATLSLAFGSGSHWPSTTNRYSCRPGATLRSPAQRPLPAAASGVCSGCQLLNEPATNTWLAAGFTSSRTTRGGGGGSAFTVTGFAASAGAGAAFTNAFFVFFVFFIISYSYYALNG